MRVIITENQYKTLLETHWDAEKLYDRGKVIETLQRGPKYIREYIKKLPKIPVQNEKGDIKMATKIPQTVHEYIFGNF
jgi:hypothetical protein